MERLNPKTKRKPLAKMRYAFHIQKFTSGKRGIAFELTFEEWWDIWNRSGKWEQRGRCKGQYCMARFGDTGSYSVDNVRIITVKENQNEYHLGRPLSEEHKKKVSESQKGKIIPADQRAKMSKWHTGKKLSDEHRTKISIASRGEKNGNASLTNQQAIEIRQLYSISKIPVRIIAKQYDVGESTVYNVINYDRYGDAR